MVDSIEIFKDCEYECLTNNRILINQKIMTKDLKEEIKKEIFWLANTTNVIIILN